MHLAATVVNPPTNPLIPELPELIIGAIAFLIVFAVLGRVLMPRIRRTMAERTDAIEGGIKRAEESQTEARQTLERYQAQLAEARHEAARMREAAKEEAAQIVARAREDAQAEAARVKEAAQGQIAADRQQALQSLRTEVGTLSVQLAGKIIDESLEDEARQRRTVDRFLEDLESRAGAGTSR